jgi:hypothetical protein
MPGYKCTSCGKWHEGPPALTWERPFHFFAVPEPERARRCVLTRETCVIDDEAFYVHACLEVPVQGTADIISFDTWVSLSKVSFARFCELLSVERRAHEGPFFAWLCDPIPTYPDTGPLKTRVHLRNHGRRPFVELERTDHPLAVEQRTGASTRRVQQLYAWLEEKGIKG